MKFADSLTYVLLIFDSYKSPISFSIMYGPQREKACLRGFANNKCADQPAHPCKLISAFVICFLESSISKLATREL